MGGLASWGLSPMKKGGLYKYLKVGRALILGNADEAADYFMYLEERCYRDEVDEITHGELVVYLDKHLVKGKVTKYSFLLIKVLTQEGKVGWVSWNLNEWEEVEACL
jgi:hypothetical protein